jgi:PTS system cellobiose-specific IIC component
MMPWVTPAPISALFAGGPVYMLILLVCIASSAVLYYPFFKVADNQAYEEEQAYAAEHTVE